MPLPMNLVAAFGRKPPLALPPLGGLSRELEDRPGGAFHLPKPPDAGRFGGG